MSREEARKRLAGTFAFELQGARVLVRDESLLDEIHSLTTSPAHFAVPALRSSAASSSRPLGYGASA